MTTALFAELPPKQCIRCGVPIPIRTTKFLLGPGKGGWHCQACLAAAIGGKADDRELARALLSPLTGQHDEEK